MLLVLQVKGSSENVGTPTLTDPAHLLASTLNEPTLHLSASHQSYPEASTSNEPTLLLPTASASHQSYPEESNTHSESDHW